MSHLLFMLLTIIVLVPSLSVDVHSQGRHRRRQLHTTPEDAIRRQIERVKEKILSQLSYSVRTAPPPGSVRSPLPQPLLHTYDVDVAGLHAESTVIDTDDSGRSRHGIQATHDTGYKQAKLIVFGHESRYTTVHPMA